jgi:hypothetical protein
VEGKTQTKSENHENHMCTYVYTYINVAQISFILIIIFFIPTTFMFWVSFLPVPE